jgi:hypothetical protein
VKNPADEALEKAFLQVALRQRRDRANKLLEEFDRLEKLEGAELIRHEPIDFHRADPDFQRAVKTVLVLVPNVEAGQVDYVSFRPVRDQAHKRLVYVVFSAEAHRLPGSQEVVSEAAWVNAWTRVGA